MTQARAGGRSSWARLALHLLMLGLLVAVTASPAGAAQPQADCFSAYALSDRGRPLSPASPSVAAGLPAPFAFEPWRGDTRALLRRVSDVVLRQALTTQAPTCFRDKIATIAGRVDLLSPYEFLVVSAYQDDPGRRDELLALYATDPRSAVRAISPIYPSARTEMILSSFAYYDVDAARIRVNTARVAEADAPRVLVHEFWHAMPRPRQWTEPDGTTYRASGFWIQQRRPNDVGWMPVERDPGLPFETYQLEEAMASLMEDDFAGAPGRPRRELEAARRFLLDLFQRAGRDEVLRLYLESRPYDLQKLASAGRPADEPR